MPDHRSNIRDAARVAHVPAIRVRRAYYLNQHSHVRKDLQPTKTTLTQAALGLLFHDAVALDTVDLLRKQLAAWLNGDKEFQREYSSMLQQQLDVFETAAATGCNAMMLWVFNDKMLLDPTSFNLERMVELACVNGHQRLTEDLWIDAEWTIGAKDRCKVFRDGVLKAAQSQSPGGSDGAAAACVLSMVSRLGTEGDPEFDAWKHEVEQLVKRWREEAPKLKRHTVSVLSAPVRSNDVSGTCPITVVLTNAELLRCIGQYQPSVEEIVKRWASTSGLLTARQKKRSKIKMYLRSRVAVIEGNLGILKAIYQVHAKSDDTDFPFHLDLHLAAIEGQLEILKWLHSRHDPRIKC